MNINLIYILPQPTEYSMVSITFDWPSFHLSSAKEFETTIDLDVDKNVPKRLASHLAGRYCAKQALLQAGFKENPIHIPTDTHRAPVWPHGWTGSITHTEEIASAAVGMNSQFRGIGIDIEKTNNKGINYKDLKQLVLTKDEILFINNFEDKTQLKLFYLFFSMKESIFKCFFPLTQVFLEFNDVDIFSVDMEKNTLKFKFNRQITSEFNHGFSHEGSFHFFGNYIFTSVVLGK